MEEAKNAIVGFAKAVGKRFLKVVLPVVLIFAVVVVLLAAAYYYLFGLDTKNGSKSSKSVTENVTVSGSTGITADPEGTVNNALEEAGVGEDEIADMNYAEKMARLGVITDDEEKQALTEVLGEGYTDEQVENMTDEQIEQLKEAVNSIILNDTLKSYGYTDEEIAGWDNRKKVRVIELLDWDFTKEQIDKMTDEEIASNLQLDAGVDLYISSAVLWKTQSVYKGYLDNITQLEKLLNAELVTQYPKLDPTKIDGLNGVITFIRVSSNGKEQELQHMDYDEFKQKVDNGDSDVTNYFAMDDSGNVVVATWKGVTTTTGGLYPDEVENADAPASSTEYEVSTTSVNYKSMASSYTMPFSYLWIFLVTTEDIDFVMDLADMVYNSDIQISLYDKITVNTETTTRSTHETAVTTANITLENNRITAKSNTEVTDYSQVTVITTTTDSVEQHLTYANVWAAIYEHKYKYVDHTTSESENVIEYGDTNLEKTKLTNYNRSWIDEAVKKAETEYNSKLKAITIYQDTTWTNTKDTVVTTSDAEKIQEIAAQKAVPKTIEGFEEIEAYEESLVEDESGDTSDDTASGDKASAGDGNNTSANNNGSTGSNGGSETENSGSTGSVSGGTTSNGDGGSTGTTENGNTTGTTGDDATTGGDNSSSSATSTGKNLLISLKSALSKLQVSYTVELTEAQTNLLDKINARETYGVDEEHLGEAWVEYAICGKAGIYGCASEAGNAAKLNEDKSNIPVGACVYGTTSGTGDSYIDHNGHDAGRVAIYIGNGNVAYNTTGQVDIFTLDEFINDRGYGWRGWSWFIDSNGNEYDLSEGAKKEYKITINMDDESVDENGEDTNNGDGTTTSGDGNGATTGGNGDEQEPETPTTPEETPPTVSTGEESTSKYDDEPTFAKAYTEHSKARTYIVEIRSWLFEALEACDDTANMVDLTRYLLNQAQNTTKYGDVSWDDLEKMFYPGTLTTIGGNYNVNTSMSDSAIVITDVETLSLAFSGYSESAALIAHADEFLELQEKYNVNAVFAAAVSITETSAGRAGHAVDGKNNWFNIECTCGNSSHGRFETYSTAKESIERFFWQIADGSYYFQAGNYNVYSIGMIYCEDADAPGGWIENTTAFMTQMFRAAGIDVSAYIGSASDVVNQARGAIGVPYVWGGEDYAGGMDCSGLVMLCYQRALGVSLAHGTDQLAVDTTHFVHVSSISELTAGDIVVMRNGNKRTYRNLYGRRYICS